MKINFTDNKLKIKKNGIFKTILENHLIYYPTPANFNYSYSFGSLVGLFFSMQIITGVFLAMHYSADIDLAFRSVHHIMEDVNNGYIFRYAHANGASMIFALLYLHMARGLFYRSYLYDRKYLWWSGMIIFVLMMGTAFIGYVLPWGQMSYWGATVITSLLTTIPVIGEDMAMWIWGGFSISNATLVRFYSAHYLLPFLIVGVILAHLTILHLVTSTNPLQIPTTDKVSFHPYFTFKDLFIFTVVLTVFFYLVFFQPNLLGHPDNFIAANPSLTPMHIVPEWYFLPFYAILRACPEKIGGVCSMGLAIVVWFIIPLYKTPTYLLPGQVSEIHKVFVCLFYAIFAILMFLGMKGAIDPYVTGSRVCSVLYFIYFLVIIPGVPYAEKYMMKKGCHN